MTATAADVVSETTLATMARDARGLAIDSISAVSYPYPLLKWSYSFMTPQAVLCFSQTPLIFWYFLMISTL